MENQIFYTKGKVTSEPVIDGPDYIYFIDSEKDGILIHEERSTIELTIPETGWKGGLVHIYKPHNRFGEIAPAEINWSTIGSQTPEVATRFAHALLLAVEIVNDINNPVVTFKPVKE